MNGHFEDGKRVATDPRTAERAKEWCYRTLAFVGMYLLVILGIAAILAMRFGVGAGGMCVGVAVLTSWGQEHARKLMLEFGALRFELLPQPITPRLAYAPPIEQARRVVLLAPPGAWDAMGPEDRARINSALQIDFAQLIADASVE